MKSTTSLGGECKHFRTAQPRSVLGLPLLSSSTLVPFSLHLLYALNYNWFKKQGTPFFFPTFFKF